MAPTAPATMPQARNGGECAHITDDPFHIFGLTYPGCDTLVLIRKRTRRLRDCVYIGKADLLAKSLKTTKRDDDDALMESKVKLLRANCPLTNYMPDGYVLLRNERENPKRSRSKPQSNNPRIQRKQPERKRANVAELNYGKRSTSQNSDRDQSPDDFQDAAIELPVKKGQNMRACNEERINTTLLKSLGLSESDVYLLRGSNRSVTRFSVFNINEPWISVHCQQLGNEVVAAALRDRIQELRKKK